MAIDFELKEFEVEDFGQPACSVTMEVKPLCGHDMDEKKYKGNKEEVAGYITGLPVPDHMLKVRVLSEFIDMMGCTHYVTPDYRAHEVEDEDHYDTDD